MSGAVAVVAKLRIQDGSEATYKCTFAADEWQRLERFVRYARS
jgi:hypothetical protein